MSDGTVDLVRKEDDSGKAREASWGAGSCLNDWRSEDMGLCFTSNSSLS